MEKLTKNNLSEKVVEIIERMLHDMAILELKFQQGDAKKMNMTYNDILYLDIIKAHPGEYTATKLADMMHVARPHVTQKINGLEERGFIYKERSKEDKRVYYLHLNLDGIPKEYKEGYLDFNRSVAEELLETFSIEEIEVFCKVAEKFNDICIRETK